MDEDGFHVFIDSVWWKDCNKYLGKAVVSQCNELRHHVLKNDGKRTLEQALAKATIAVVDIVRNGSRVQDIIIAAKAMAKDEDIEREEPLCLVGISTYMTWNKTRTNAAMLDEMLYTRRSASPKYKTTKALETLLLNSAVKDIVEPVVIAPGAVYGMGEDTKEGFFQLFKTAWMCKPVRVLGDGKTMIPTIHVADLAQVVFHVQAEPPEKPYIVAVDRSKVTLGQLGAALSSVLGTGETKSAPGDSLEALSGQCGNVEMLLWKRRFKSGYITELEEKGMEWECKSGPVENLERLCKEFISVNNLRPLKLFIHGRPGSGKSYFAKKLAKLYYLKIVDLKAIRTELMKNEEFAKKEEAKAKKKVKRKEKAIPVELITTAVKAILRSPECRNQGFILDGYPYTIDQTHALLTLTPEEAQAKLARELEEKKKRKGSEEDDDEDEDQDDPEVEQDPDEHDGDNKLPNKEPAKLPDPVCIPECVIDLNIPEDKAKQRVQNIMSAEVVPGQNDEDGFKRRSEFFRKSSDRNADPPTCPLEPLRSSIEILEVPFEKQENKEAIQFMCNYVEKGNKPENFRPTEEESYADQMAREAKILEEKTRDERAKKALLEKEAKVRMEREQRDNERRKQVLYEEQALIENCSIPLRKYLMANVIPPLIQGLLEVCRVQPDDPVDYLAEFLFKASNKSDEEDKREEKDEKVSTTQQMREESTVKTAASESNE